MQVDSYGTHVHRYHATTSDKGTITLRQRVSDSTSTLENDAPGYSGSAMRIKMEFSGHTLLQVEPDGTVTGSTATNGATSGDMSNDDMDQCVPDGNGGCDTTQDKGLASNEFQNDEVSKLTFECYIHNYEVSAQLSIPVNAHQCAEDEEDEGSVPKHLLAAIRDF